MKDLVPPTCPDTPRDQRAGADLAAEFLQYGPMDQLRSARAARERHVGSWLPELELSYVQHQLAS